MDFLTVENLCKTYGKGETEVRAIDNLSFSVPKGAKQIKTRQICV